MCGVVGYTGRRSYAGALNAAVGRLHHRGPDHSASREYLLNGTVTGLGHTRLSIIDLDPRSHQPMTSEDNRYVISYNGEIYNFKELRARLLAAGRSFRTQSDTEVILVAFEQWGVEAFARLRGIFAFALLDTAARRLYLVRDHLGVKPLYYTERGGELFFASEIVGLRPFLASPPSVDEYDLFQALSTKFCYEPRTGYSDILKVPQGSYIVWQGGALGSPQSYLPALSDTKGDIAALEGLCQRSCAEQTMADVPVCLLFSGGVDSTFIGANIDANLTAIFARYPQHDMADAGIVSDAQYVDAVASNLGLKLQTSEMKDESHNPDAILRKYKHVAEKVEEPIADLTFDSTEHVCRVAKNAGMTVALSGMGGDEVFAGYPRYLLARHAMENSAVNRLLMAGSWVGGHSRRLAKKMPRLRAYIGERDFGLKYSRLLGYLSRTELDELFGAPELHERLARELAGILAPVEHLSPLKKAMYLDRFGFLSHNLIVADKASMQTSVELRVPLLDYDLMQSAFALPDSTLIRGHRLKAVLKYFLEKKLPPNLVRRPKAGFHPPLDGEIRRLGASRIRDVILNGRLARKLKRAPMERTIGDHFSGVTNNTHKIWLYLFMTLWLENASEPVALAAE